MISLSRLLLNDLENQITHDINFAQFKNDVAYNASQLSGQSVILFEDSTYAFAVGLMAALHAGCKVSLPPNAQPGTLKKLDGTRLILELGQQADFDFHPLDVNSCILDFFTSGSTGDAKCIRKTLRQIENEITVLEDTFGAQLGGAIALATVSHQHIYGMLFKVLWPLSAGRPFYDEMFEYWENLVPRICEDSFIISSPAHLTRYPVLEIQTSPKMIFSSGGPLPFDAAIETQSLLSKTPIEVFGSTETGGIAYRQQIDEATPWTPFSAIDVQSDDYGVLSIRSPYLEDEHWYEMSDKVEFLSNNKFLLKGRIDRIVKVEGKRVSLAEVEAVALQSPYVKEAAALIVKDERQSLSCVIVLTSEGQAQLDEIGKFRMGRLLRTEMRNNLDQAALPRRWRFMKKMPVNSQGKRLLSDLLSLY